MQLTLEKPQDSVKSVDDLKLSAVKEGSSAEEEKTTQESQDAEIVNKVDSGTQMEELRALIPFDFAHELKLFSEQQVIALR